MSGVVVDPNGRQYSRESFDRFGDDMCEQLLSYLTFEDKLRIQLVAKQWNRTILNKQSVLKISSSDKSSDRVRQLFGRNRTRYFGDGPIDSTRLKSLLKKCPNIRTIDFCWCAIDDQFLDVVIECCPRLTTIALSVKHLSSEAITRFGQRFGQTLKSIQYNYEYDELKQRLLLSLCPNVQSLESNLFLSKTGWQSLHGLKRLHVRTNRISEALGSCIAQLGPTLKCLEMSPKNIHSGAQQLVANSLYFLTDLQLEQVSFGKSIMLFNVHENLFEMMPKVKRLTLPLPIEEYHCKDEVLFCISRLQSLRQITLFVRIMTMDKGCDTNAITDLGVIDLIDNCPKLTNIEFKFCPQLTSQTVDKWIEVAISRPKEWFRFKCFGSQELKQYNSSVNKPKNLVIVIE